jgi:FMN phosphatase YigB (HAD superfamily)
MNNCRIDGIFIDLDGVILKNSVNIYLKFVADYINKFTPIPFDFIKNYYRLVNSFPLSDALYLVFNSLGLTDKLSDLFEEINNLKEYKNESIIVEGGFYRLVDFCNTNNIQYKIFTLASLEKTASFLNDISPKNFYCLDKKAKADIKTYDYVKKDLNIEFNNWLLIDDDPLSLRTAYLCGLKTFLIKGALYDEAYCNDFRQYFHAVNESLDDIITFIKT